MCHWYPVLRFPPVTVHVMGAAPLVAPAFHTTLLIAMLSVAVPEITTLPPTRFAVVIVMAGRLIVGRSGSRRGLHAGGVRRVVELSQRRVAEDRERAAHGPPPERRELGGHVSGILRRGERALVLHVAVDPRERRYGDARRTRTTSSRDCG